MISNKKPAALKRTGSTIDDADPGLTRPRPIVNAAAPAGGRVELVTSRDRAETFKRLAFDRSVPHGATRLFQVLFTFCDENATCFPGQRLLRKALGCSASSLKPWIEALERGGYLSTEARFTSRGLLTVYTLHFCPVNQADSGGVFPVSETPPQQGVSGFAG
ncbi:MAG TPA: helix-turn-helix domain-containing protein, partial [Verrucomicrobiae bacterium]|nr:helix-turn-helix domain-containing protein [Verrucomicrobiae bacterium]